jgi:cytidylate kinase
MEAKMAVVTIRGQLGSGASEVGRQIAELLKADYVDREVIAEVAARLNRDEQEVLAKETPPSGLLERIAEALEGSAPLGVGFEGAYLPAWEIPLDDARYFQTLESVVRELARKEPLVIQGRGSQFTLKNHPGIFRVQLVAPLEVRLKRVMEELKADPETAKQAMARFEGSSRKFVKRYFQVEVEDPVHYDLVVNTERLSFPAAASIVAHALSARGGT